MSRIGSGFLLTPLLEKCSAMVFIMTALHNVYELRCSLESLSVSFGRISNQPYFKTKLNGRVVSHGSPKEPLKLFPECDWAIVELNVTSGELYSLFDESSHYPPIPIVCIPRPSKVEKSIDSNKYSLAMFSIPLEERDAKVQSRTCLFKKQGSICGSFGYGLKVSKHGLLHNIGTMSGNCSGAMVVNVDYPINNMIPFIDSLKSVPIRNVNVIGIHVDFGQGHNSLLCPATEWFEEYYKLVFPTIHEHLHPMDARKIQNELLFMHQLDKFNRASMIRKDFNDINITFK